ncbi:MAG: TIGR02996 domain-containing protein [Kofleriaceae bacterium]
MGSVLAIVSKAVFEKLVKTKGSGELGDVLGIDRYTSTHASLSTLESGGAIFLVTVRPPDEALWLVGILENPELAADGWHAEPSTHAITDVSSAKSKLKFVTGTGITAKPGALGMSLQTPRVLTDADAALLRGGKAAKPAAKAKPAAAKPAAKAKATAKPAAKATAKAKTAAKTTAAKPAAKATTSGAPTDLAAIAQAIDDEDGAAALDAALAAWRANRAPELADLVDAISAAVTSTPVGGETDFTAATAGRDPLAFGRLLPAITELPVSFLPTAMELLASFPDDPRLGKAACAWILEPPTLSSSTFPFWTKFAAALDRLGDTRVLPPIAKRVKLPGEASKQRPTAKNPKPSLFWGKYYTVLEKLATKIKARPAPGKVDAKAIAKLVKAAAALEAVEPSATPKVKQTAAPKVEGPPLVQALAHAKANRIGAAIDALLEYWRTNRVARVADVIERATRLLPSYDRTLPAEPKAAHQAWMATFADDPIGEMPCLLFHLRAPAIIAVERQLVELAGLPDDPRLSLRLAEIATCGGGSPERTQYWKSLWQLILKLKDTRTIAPLRGHFNDFTGNYFDHHKSGRRILAGWLLDPGPIPALEPEDTKPLLDLEAALGKLEAAQDTTERDLIDAIIKDWSDEGPRLVYADWLLERGRNRGETIVLACKQARSELSKAEGLRLRQLEGNWSEQPRTYGALSDIGYLSDRGIPTQLKLEWNASTITLRRAAGDPLLACIEKLELEEPRAVFGEDLAAVMMAPHAKRLTAVTGVATELLDATEPFVTKAWKVKAGGFVRK